MKQDLAPSEVGPDRASPGELGTVDLGSEVSTWVRDGDVQGRDALILAVAGSDAPGGWMDGWASGLLRP